MTFAIISRSNVIMVLKDPVFNDSVVEAVKSDLLNTDKSKLLPVLNTVLQQELTTAAADTEGALSNNNNNLTTSQLEETQKIIAKIDERLKESELKTLQIAEIDGRLKDSEKKTDNVIESVEKTLEKVEIVANAVKNSENKAVDVVDIINQSENKIKSVVNNLNDAHKKIESVSQDVQSYVEKNNEVQRKLDALVAASDDKLDKNDIIDILQKLKSQEEPLAKLVQNELEKLSPALRESEEEAELRVSAQLRKALQKDEELLKLLHDHIRTVQDGKLIEVETSIDNRVKNVFTEHLPKVVATDGGELRNLLKSIVRETLEENHLIGENENNVRWMTGENKLRLDKIINILGIKDGDGK